MSGAMEQVGSRGLGARQVGVWLWSCAWLALGAALIVTCGLLLRDAIAGVREVSGQSPDVAWGGIWIRAACACVLYGAAHALRAVRLCVLISDERVSLRSIALSHVTASGASLLIPFKLGELFRVAEVGRLTGSLVRGGLTVLMERAFDLGAIMLLAVVAMVARPALFRGAAGGAASGAADGKGLGGLAVDGAVLTLAVLVCAIAAVYVAPSALESVKLFCIRRYRGDALFGRGEGVVRGLTRAQEMLERAPAAVRARPALLAGLTAGVWALEVLAIAALLPANGAEGAGFGGAAYVGAGFFVSQVFPEATGTFASLVQRVSGADAAAGAIALYPQVIFCAYVCAGVGAFVFSIPARVQELAARAVAARRGAWPAWVDESLAEDAAHGVGEGGAA